MKNAEKLAIRDDGRGAVIAVKVVPGSSRDKVVGVLGDALKIATAAAPERGKANAAVAATLAKALRVNERDVQLVSGSTNPRKEFRVSCLSAAELRRRVKGAE